VKCENIVGSAQKILTVKSRVEAKFFSQEAILRIKNRQKWADAKKRRALEEKERDDEIKDWSTKLVRVKGGFKRVPRGVQTVIQGWVSDELALSDEPKARLRAPRPMPTFDLPEEWL
jgi:hypothetical protein